MLFAATTFICCYVVCRDSSQLFILFLSCLQRLLFYSQMFSFFYDYLLLLEKGDVDVCVMVYPITEFMSYAMIAIAYAFIEVRALT